MLNVIRATAIALLIGTSGGAAWADATVPTKDIANAKDNPLLKRYEGSYLVSYDRAAYTDFTVPLSRLEWTDDSRDSMNNRFYKPKEKLDVEGPRTRLVYLLPEDRSPLEVLRGYQDEIEKAGGSVLFTCKAEGCGGDETRSSSGGGGSSSLMMLFFHAKDLKDPAFSNGDCTLTSGVTDQRFISAKMPTPDGDAYVTVQSYQILGGPSCRAISGRTAAVVNILEPNPREKKMVQVKAEDMARAIDTTGRIALYGILFDTDKTDIKPDSAPTLEQIAALLKQNAKLSVLIVGHTDNQGAFDHNLDLSKRRADAVIKALATTYKVDAKQMRGLGVGMAAPTASNDAEDGRAKNRRVELVKLN